MAIIVRSASAATVAAAPVIVPLDDPANTPVTPERPSSPGLEMLEERPARVGLGKRPAARSPSLERHNNAAAHAVKRRLTCVQ